MVESSAQRAFEVSPNAEADLATARAAIKRRDFDAAIATFRRLRATALEAEGEYGLGWIAKEQGRLVDADRYFRRAIEFDPGHAHSYWQLGKLALTRDARSEAETLFRMAVEAQPGHAAALDELAKLGVTPGRPQPPVGRPAVDDFGSPGDPAAARIDAPLPIDLDGPFGVYEYLRKDRSHLARHAVAVLDRMQFERYPPTYLSFFGFSLPGPKDLFVKGLTALIAIVVLGGIVGTLLGLSAPVAAQPPPVVDPTAAIRQAFSGFLRLVGGLVIWLYVAVVLTVLMRFLRHITTRVRLERGRLQVERGLFTRSRTNLELWRVQNILLERRGFHLLTGDGSLVFLSIAGTEPITITGLARGRELDRLHEELLDLVFLLRSNPSIKGIVQ